MRDDFAVFILIHGRPDRQYTLSALERAGYTGRLFIVIDDEDETGDEYRALYGDQVLVFSKDQIAATFDTGDNFTDRRTIVYARNACWDLARQNGVRYMMQLDDDYHNFSYRTIGRKDGETRDTYHGWTIRSIDQVLEAMIAFVESTPTASLAMAQGGDFAGGQSSDSARVRLKRKAMNSFLCDTERPFTFIGRVNEDVNTYVHGGHTGLLFFTYTTLQLMQELTQNNPGGMTDTYLDSGTYLKSFYTIMYAPSCTDIRMMGKTERRLHHRINWDTAVPKIIPQTLRLVTNR